MALPQPMTGATDNPNVQQPLPVQQTPPAQQNPQTAQPPSGIQLSGPNPDANQEQPTAPQPQQAAQQPAAPPSPQPVQQQQPQDPYAMMGKPAPQQPQDPYMSMGSSEAPDQKPTALDYLISAPSDKYREIANHPILQKMQQYLPEVAAISGTLNGIADLKDMKEKGTEITPAAAAVLAMVFGIPNGLAAGAEGVAGAASSAVPNIASATEDMMGAMKNKGPITPAVPPTASEQMSQAFGEASKDTTTDTNPPLLSKTAGETTQNPTLQAREQDMKSNAAGPQAATQATNFAQTRNTQLKSLPGVTGAQEAGNPADHIADIANIIKGKEANDNEAINTQYEIAKNSADGAGITKADMEGIVPEPDKHGFINLPTGEGKAPITINPETTKGAFQQYKKLQDIITNEEEGSDSILTPLQIWRQQTTNLSKSVTDPTDKLALRTLVKTYDGHMDNLASTLPENGSQGITAFKQAVAMRREYGQKYENNPLVEGMIYSSKSVDDIRNEALGSGTLKSKKELANTYDATISAAGDQAPAVKQSWQQAVAQKIYNNSSSGKLPNSTETALSPQKLQTELTNLFVNQREFATKVFGEADTTAAQQAISELKQINSKQPGVVNNSNTAYAIARNVATKAALNKIPGLSYVYNSIKESINNMKAGQEAEGLFSGQIPKGAVQKMKPTDAEGGNP